MNQGATRQLVPTQFIAGSATTYYTSPFPVGSNFFTKMTGVIFANTDSAAHTFTGYNIPSGGTASASNQIFPAVSIPANTAWIGEYELGFLFIPAGGFLQFLASVASKITITLNGIEVSS